MTDNKEREALYLAAINCPHEIDANRVVLYYDGTKPGHNALAQLGDRLAKAAHQVPPGFALVPIEPTDAMTFIGQKHRYDPVWSIGAIYREMLAAAPKPHAPPAESPADSWAPERIWLQRGMGDEGSHTWCEDSQDEHEQAEYVRVESPALTDEQREQLELIERCQPDLLLKHLEENTAYDAKLMGRVFDLAKERARALLATAAQPQGVTDAARDVLAERQRHVQAEGWTPEHDDEHDPGVLASAATAYAGWAADMLYPLSLGDGDRDREGAPPIAWPWDREWWKPVNPRRALEKAGALILAEIERIDRKGDDRG